MKELSGSTHRSVSILPTAPLARLRLLVALDALLINGTVSGAARMLGLSAPAMSRLLAQLREVFGDDLLRRSGRKMVPTPLATELRARVHSIVEEAGAVMRGDAPESTAVAVHKPPPAVQIGNRLPPQTRPLTVGPVESGDPRVRLAVHVATAGNGTVNARPLSVAEAQEAFSIVFAGQADPVQIGALIVALQSRGVTAQELAGIVRAARSFCACPKQGGTRPDLDWPVYMSPRSRRAPLFLLAVAALALAGRKVLLHGLGQGVSQFGPVLDVIGIPVAASPDDASRHLEKRAIAFLPLPALMPQMQALISLYRHLGMRTPLNLAVALLNPFDARCSLLGASTLAASQLLRDGGDLLMTPRVLCVNNQRDIAQATPHRLSVLTLSGARVPTPQEFVLPAWHRSRPKGIPQGFSTEEYCAALWSGGIRDPEAEAVITGTIALGLHGAEDGMKKSREQILRAARALWANRSS